MMAGEHQHGENLPASGRRISRSFTGEGGRHRNAIVERTVSIGQRNRGAITCAWGVAVFSSRGVVHHLG
jgi:hypothetical protein